MYLFKNLFWRVIVVTRIPNIQPAVSGYSFKQWRTGNEPMKSAWRIFCKMKICPMKTRQKMVPLKKTAEAGASFAVPKKAEIARERKVQLNPPPRPGQKRNPRECKDPPRVCAWDRVKTYKGEYLRVVEGMLHCNAR